jgi:hypothetical protein
VDGKTLSQSGCIYSTTSIAWMGTMDDVSRCVITVITTCHELFDDDVYDEMTVHTVTMVIMLQLQHTKDF